MIFKNLANFTLGMAAAAICAWTQPAWATTGIQIQIYEDPAASNTGNFGEAVTAYNNQPLVGAPDAEDGGRVYLYDGGFTPNPVRTFLPPAFLAPRAFGRAVTTLGNQILISDTAAQPVSGPNFYGAVVHYQDSNDTTPVIIPNPGPGTGFGTALDFAPSGKFAVGDPYMTSSSVVQVGRVYVYSGSNSTPELTLESPVLASQARFGREVAFFDDAPVIPPPVETDYAGTLAVGAPGLNRVYLFNQVDGSLARDIPRPVTSYNDFGAALATSGELLIVGAPNTTVASRTAAGVVVVIHRATGDVVRTITAPTATKNEYFGTDLAVLGSSYLIVGTRSVVGTAGKVYVYNINTGALVGTCTSPHSDRLRFGLSVAAVGENVLVGDPQGTPGASSGTPGQALLFTGPDSDPVVPDAPSNLNATAPISTRVNLSWIDNSANEDGFTIERKRDDEILFTVLGTVPSDTTEYTDEQGVLPSREYCYRVKAYNADGSSDYSNTACVTTPDGSQDDLIGEVTHPGGAGDLFGYAIGKLKLGKQLGFVIGAPGTDEGGTTDVGRAYVYYPPNVDPVATLNHPEAPGNESSYFGHSVASIGNYVLVGAPGPETTFGNGGRVYMFEAATGQFNRSFASPNPAPGEQFGYSVSAIGKNDVIVGAPATLTGNGKTYIYNLKKGTVATIEDDDTSVGNAFGHAVAGGKGKLGVVSLDTICSAGEVDFFKKKGKYVTGMEEAYSIADANGKFLVGAPNHLLCAGAGPGHAYLVGGKKIKAMYTSPNTSVVDGFGYGVGGGKKFQGIGAALYDEPGFDEAGRAYLFRTKTNTPAATFVNPSPGTGDRFGQAVALQEKIKLPNKQKLSVMAIGAPYSDNHAPDAGTVYFYEIPLK